MILPSTISPTKVVQISLNHDQLVKQCKNYLLSLHCTLWRDWIIEPDKVHEDGTTEPRGLTNAAEWLATTMEKVLMPPPLTDRK